MRTPSHHATDPTSSTSETRAVHADPGPLPRHKDARSHGESPAAALHARRAERGRACSSNERGHVDDERINDAAARARSRSRWQSQSGAGRKARSACRGPAKGGAGAEMSSDAAKLENKSERPASPPRPAASGEPVAAAEARPRRCAGRLWQARRRRGGIGGPWQRERCSARLPIDCGRARRSGLRR